MHEGGVQTFGRAAFLRAGMVGAATVAGTALVAPSARAGLPAPVPVDDDVGYLQFTATGELVAVSLGTTLLQAPGFTAAQRQRLQALRAGSKRHLARLSLVLGADAPQFGDFDLQVPAPPGGTPKARLATSLDLAGLLAGVYLAAVSDTVDAATRGLHGRLLWSQAQQVSTLRVLSGLPSVAGGLPVPIPLEAAVPRLDAYLADAEPPV
ncbi:hypothetical protein DSM112329_02578 [Paraconexibacter sp. AEG42_29]|uniref:DUF4439 domain-containing protein n=2 Tax=Paraconexibacter sp. AEG42_29 TaxID=2997339 RepID=A0AAU7AVV8_9ACTN